ncbi:MAG: S-layer homology domain-containing protein, partial [Firmicutes bacterium]|nr:S-layer homology domain-containing protein [Bacillota bacterium]
TLVLLASTLCQTAVFAAFSDVDDTNAYKTAITTLSKLSVIDGYTDGTFQPEGTITRAEFTKLIVFILGYQDFTYTDIDFTDVSSDHWAKDYIQTAYNLGIISGMGDGTFAPDSQVTYEQALKMTVCTLGYESFATAMQQDGEDWSSGYIRQANSLNLTKNVTDAEYTEGATRGVIAQVLYNALDVTVYENNGYEWVETSKTLMKDYLKVRSVKGTLIGIEDYVTEDCTEDLLENQMAVMDSSGDVFTMDYSEYTETVSDISQYLGNTITVYYRQLSDDDECTLIAIDDETTKNSQLEISYDDISSFSGNTLKYYETSSSVKSLKLKDSDLTVRYNGKLVGADDTVTLTNPSTQEEEDFTRTEALEEWLTPGSDYFIYGTATLTDNGDDGTFDMIQIYDYETIVAYTSPSSSDYRITDRLVTGNYLILDPQAASYSYTITKNGESIAVTSIAANDIVLYATSLDGSVYTLLVTNTSVSGSVTSMSSSSSKISIANTSYTLGDKCESYISDKSGKELKVGVSGTFYIDAFGTVVYGTLTETSAIPYAYITDAYIDYDEGGKPYITVYSTSTTSGAESYALDDKIKLNGSTISGENAIDRLAESAEYANGDEEYAEKIYGAGKTPTLTGYSQPARVTISNNKVTEIVTLTSDEVQSQNDDSDQIVLCKDIDEYTYSSNSFTLDGKSSFSVNSSTIVICVPENRTTKSSYSKKTVSSAFTSGDSYYLEAYDISSSKIAGLIVLYGNDGTLTAVKKDTDYSIVATLPETIYDEDRDTSAQTFDVYAGATNTAKTWTTYDTEEFSDIEVGDVIQFAYDSDNLAQGLITNISFSDIAAVLDGETTYNDQLYNWEEEQDPTEENNYQEYKFDYRFKQSGTDDDETYTSTSLGTVPYSRACMYNISQVLVDDKKLYVTKGGFYTDENGTTQIDDSDYEEITITSSTKILRMTDKRDEISRYAADTTTDMSISDLRDAKNYGADCSKILVCSMKGVAKLIVVYN